jgi:glycogen phosphorylase
MVKELKVKIAYFSMEIALENAIKSYAGGLGVLAGDTLKSAADLKVPMAGITLLNNQGYFKQIISKDGQQIEAGDKYDHKKFKKLKDKVTIKIGKDDVVVQAWEYLIKGYCGYLVPVYFLDTNLTVNKKIYRELTGTLYKAGNKYRFMQEIVLGIAGVKILKKMGYLNIIKYHLNEGHAALAPVELYNSSLLKTKAKKLEEVKRKCVFTTHTPVEAGHDTFEVDSVKSLIADFPWHYKELVEEKKINMTKLALHFSSHVNGVALSHQKISNKMFPGHFIYAITNGIHSRTWASPDFKKLFDKYIPTWRQYSSSLRNAFNIPPKEIWQTHQQSKKRLIDFIYKKQKIKLELNTFTIGFARRFTGYKRSTLLFYDIERLRQISKKAGKIQIIYAGKAHPNDENGKALIKYIYEAKEKLKKDIQVVFIENYDMDVAKLLIPGVDIWLNTPLPPNEASGTSGMKAALNGVPHFSTLDGWWIEGFINKKTGWSIGERRSSLKLKELNKKDADNLYDTLELKILPRYYQTPNRWRETMRHTIAVNASFFNSERMLQQYIQSAYL